MSPRTGNSNPCPSHHLHASYGTRVRPPPTALLVPVKVCRIMRVLSAGFLITPDWTLAYGEERPPLPEVADVIGYGFRIGQVMW